MTTTIPWSEHEAGDHYIVVGRVTELSPLPAAARDPLLFYRGAYRHLRSLESA
ncbi:flavin reductase [Microbacterium sp. CJ88]|uniref:flavin reductase n=1 Tax=Microbacterium sp. CJ88 TaxID=3445672 RepID=UPI003F6565B4